MAVTRRKPPAGVVHHSDRGSQYTSLAFGTTLRESGLVASIGRRGDAYDNAACESVISTIKNELIKRRSWTSRDQARLAVFSYIEAFYNPRRRHSALGYRSPVEYENMTQEAPANAAAAQRQGVNGNGAAPTPGSEDRTARHHLTVDEPELPPCSVVEEDALPAAER
jgi:hypothetical protein